jgi:hypothetical protein
VRTIRRRLRGHPAETRIAVSSSILARVRVRVRGRGLNRAIYLGDSSDASAYDVRVLWGCLARARTYKYTVTAYPLGTRAAADAIVVSRGAFTVDTPRVCRSLQPRR